MSLPTNEEVKELRDSTGVSLMEAKKALIKYNGDTLRATAYLRYKDCTLYVKDGKFEEWLTRRIEQYVKQKEI